MNWASKVIASNEQPEWKTKMAHDVLNEKIGDDIHTVNITMYSDDNRIDPRTGGGSIGCSWAGGGQPVNLKWGHVATRNAYIKSSKWPTGTVFFAPRPFNRTWIVVDSGPGVGRNQIDVYCKTESQASMVEKVGRLSVVRLGCISRRDALR